MQTKNLPKNGRKQFLCILNANEITLYTLPDLLKENNLNLKGYYHNHFLNSAYKIY